MGEGQLTSNGHDINAEATGDGSNESSREVHVCLICVCVCVVCDDVGTSEQKRSVQVGTKETRRDGVVLRPLYR